ncbi:D-alanine--D-alanine ligase family protein [Demequina rhizosphaerae]|uniref:D-alanine--D-alanine ligase family protein n=1 Tax=Demequina rhizosphaerae TaxID=1638985 RepID=UPI000A49CD54|nr:D-alanine--D-alanine ligase [Demequina rhizosphaerae]
MHALILAGGLSHERDVSIRSGRRVQDALRGKVEKVSLLDVDTELMPTLRSGHVDVVWPLLHGATGEDGSLQALLELVGVPFVGTASGPARVAWNKAVAKTVMGRAGIATPDHVTLPQSLFREVGAEQVLDTIVARFGMPVVVKPARGGSALGVSVVHDRADLARAMVHCFAYGDVALVERFVEGTEVAMSVLGTGDDARVLPAVETVTEGAYDYDARYNPGRVEYFAPARLTEPQARQAAETALAVHRSMDLRDLSRVDIILDTDGLAQVIDINIAPGMTETSLFPQAAEAAKLDLGEVYGDLVVGAAARAATV